MYYDNNIPKDKKIAIGHHILSNTDALKEILTSIEKIKHNQTIKNYERAFNSAKKSKYIYNDTPTKYNNDLYHL